MTIFSVFFFLTMIGLMKNMFEGGNSLNNHKKEPDISIKLNDGEQSIIKTDDSFQWVLPNGKPENVIEFKDFQKKSKIIKQKDIPKLKSKKRAEIFLLIFFAIIIGCLFGTSVMGILPEVTSKTKSTQVGNITLDPVQVYVEQQGVYSELSGAERVSQSIQPSIVLERDKYYVLTGVAGNSEMLSDSNYIKQMSVESISLENIDEQSGTSIQAIREMLVQLLNYSGTSEQLAKLESLSKSIVETELIDKELQQSVLNAYENAKNNSDTLERKQSLLQFFVNYDKFIHNIQ